MKFFTEDWTKFKISMQQKCRKKEKHKTTRVMQTILSSAMVASKRDKKTKHRISSPDIQCRQTNTKDEEISFCTKLGHELQNEKIS